MFLHDIVTEASDITEFIGRKTFIDFVGDRMTMKAVTHCLDSIGEASKHIPETVKRRHPQIEWKKISGFRDFATHHYWELDYGIIWDIAKNHLPKLLAVVKEELKRLAPP